MLPQGEKGDFAVKLCCVYSGNCAVKLRLHVHGSCVFGRGIEVAICLELEVPLAA